MFFAGYDKPASNQPIRMFAPDFLGIGPRPNAHGLLATHRLPFVTVSFLDLLLQGRRIADHRKLLLYFLLHLPSHLSLYVAVVQKLLHELLLGGPDANTGPRSVGPEILTALQELLVARADS